MAMVCHFVFVKKHALISPMEWNSTVILAAFRSYYRLCQVRQKSLHTIPPGSWSTWMAMSS